MLARRVAAFTESVIRETTRRALRHGAINLAQGMPDFDTPDEIKEAACQAIREGFNQYAVTWGAPVLRQAIAEKAQRFNGIACDPDRHVTVCCGATECMMATMLALIDPGDEVVMFQPFYENYGPDGVIAGARPRWVRLRPPDWRLDRDELRAAFNNRTKAIIVNTPHNPTGKVFRRAELEWIAELCCEYGAIAVTDEIYEHMIHTDDPHVSLATLPGMAERTVTVSGLSKTFSVTGWRLGYCIAPEAISTAIRQVHDFLTVGAPHPLQVAGAAALRLPGSYYTKLRDGYRRRREVFLPYLEQAGLKFHPPEGAYYVMCDFAALGFADDAAFLEHLLTEVGVAGVPGSSFHDPAADGRHLLRFMFAKKEETLHEAGRKLATLAGRLRR